MKRHEDRDLRAVGSSLSTAPRLEMEKVKKLARLALESALNWILAMVRAADGAVEFLEGKRDYEFVAAFRRVLPAAAPAIANMIAVQDEVSEYLQDGMSIASATAKLNSQKIGLNWLGGSLRVGGAAWVAKNRPDVLETLNEFRQAGRELRSTMQRAGLVQGR